jgi:hypothetical protein
VGVEWIAACMSVKTDLKCKEGEDIHGFVTKQSQSVASSTIMPFTDPTNKTAYGLNTPKNMSNHRNDAEDKSQLVQKRKHFMEHLKTSTPPS